MKKRQKFEKLKCYTDFFGKFAELLVKVIFGKFHFPMSNSLQLELSFYEVMYL
jgi:hypothetical protein